MTAPFAPPPSPLHVAVILVLRLFGLTLPSSDSTCVGARADIITPGFTPPGNETGYQ